MSSSIREYIAKRRSWFTAQDVADYFVISYTTAYKAVQEVYAANGLEISYRRAPGGRKPRAYFRAKRHEPAYPGLATREVRAQA